MFIKWFAISNIIQTAKIWVRGMLVYFVLSKMMINDKLQTDHDTVNEIEQVPRQFSSHSISLIILSNVFEDT